MGVSWGQLPKRDGKEAPDTAAEDRRWGCGGVAMLGVQEMDLRFGEEREGRGGRLLDWLVSVWYGSAERAIYKLRSLTDPPPRPPTTDREQGPSVFFSRL